MIGKKLERIEKIGVNFLWGLGEGEGMVSQRASKRTTESPTLIIHD